jgi:hypothetical protein
LVRIKQGKINLESQGKSVDLGIAAPPGVQTPAEENWSLSIHNSRITVLHRSKDPEASSVNEGSSPIHVWTAQSGRWATFRVPGAIPIIKNLGGWIAGAAAVESLDRQSPGAVNRRQYPPPAADVNSTPPPRPAVPTRPVTDEMFREIRQYYGGVLFLIDPQSGRQFQIRTGEGDSEILLVQDNSVYYRVNAKLYKAQIQGSSIGAPELVVEADAITDVHWAFFGS